MSGDTFPFEIRWAYLQEWEEAIALVWNAFLQSEGKRCSEEGKKDFYRFITDKELRDSFLKGEYPMMVAIDDRRIIGVASVRYCNHLSLLFVDKQYHGRGIGRALVCAVMQYVRDKGERYMSLQAASDAVNFYRKLGFRAIRPEEEFSGIRITCMEKFF